MFRFFRNNDKYPYAKTAIPLELNYYDKESDDFNFIGYFDKAKKIELRSFYINDKGETIVRFFKPEDEKYYEHETVTERVTDVVMKFFDQVFENIIGL